MDFIKNAVGGGDGQGEDNTNQQGQIGDKQQQQQSLGGNSEGGFLGGMGDKLNSMAGGGKESEKNEDYLDKGTCSNSFRRPSHILGR